MKIDLKKLAENLPKLTSTDFIEAETAITNGGNVLIDARYHSGLQARLVAKALDIPYPEIANLPVPEFVQVKLVVMNFLFNADSGTPTPSEVSA